MKGGDKAMYVTYNELFSFCIVVIGIITLVITLTKK